MQAASHKVAGYCRRNFWNSCGIGGRKMNREIFAQLAELSAQAKPAEFVTLVSAPDSQAGYIGQMLLLTAGKHLGQLVDEEFTRLVIDKIASLVWKKPITLDLEYEGASYRFFWDRLSKRRSALILGAGHISQPLTSLLAMLEYSVTVVDDRPDFANTRRFPQAETVICKEFGQALAELNLSSFGAIIVVTRGHRSDMECLRAVIDQPALYVGMIGSQGRVRIVINTLMAEGIDKDALARLHAPIGLDIGAETPTEIALSIAAEVVAVSSGANFLPLSYKWRCK
ncbi:hypothetical protein SRRS_41830 [Sporomusa rhizae]